MDVDEDNKSRLHQEILGRCRGRYEALVNNNQLGREKVIQSPFLVLIK